MALRTPPVKASLLALRESLGTLGSYNGLPLNEVFIDLYERLGIGPPDEDPDDPDEPSTTVVTDESFDGTLDGEVVAAGTTTAADVVGSGSLTHSSDWQISGGVSMKVAGTDQHYIVFEPVVPAHALKLEQFYMKVVQAPSDTVWFHAVVGGGAVAFQLGLNESLQLELRTGDSGAVDDTSAALTLDTQYRVEITVTGGSSVSVRLWGGTSINSTVVGDAFDTITCPITPATLAAERLGVLEAVAGSGSVTGNLKNLSFDGGSNGDTPTIATSGASAVLGSGLTFSNTWAKDGTLSLSYSGTAYGYLRLDNATHTLHFTSFYYRHTTTPGSTAVIYELMAGDTTTTAAQIRIDTTGHINVRNGTASVATSTLTLASGDVVRIDCSYDGAGGQTVRVYTDTAEDSTALSGTDIEVVANNAALTATNFSRERLGNTTAITSGTFAGRFDKFKSDSVVLPVGTAAVGGEFYFDRFKTDTATMPTLITVTDPDTPPPPTGYSLAPPTGALFGVTAANTGVKGQTTPAGLEAWLNATGDHYPHIIGRYYTGTRSWVFNAEERQLFDPTTGRHAGAHAIPFLHWKIPGTWAQVAAGAQNAAIDQFIAGIRQYPRKIFMALPHHEPELEIASPGYTTADYKAMHRHFVTYIRSKYLPGVPNMEFVMQYTGYSNFADDDFETLYAGDDIVDWIGWDPYPHSFTRNTWDELLNETIASGGTPSYTGFYDWARATHPTKNLMLSEWGLDVNPESGTGMGQANVSTVLTNYLTQVQAFPEVKAVVYWNSVTANGNYQMQGTSCGDEMSDLIELPWFTQDIDLFP